MCTSVLTRVKVGLFNLGICTLLCSFYDSERLGVIFFAVCDHIPLGNIALLVIAEYENLKVFIVLYFFFIGNNNANNNNGVNEYVRQELRAVVGARQQGNNLRLPQIQVGPGQQVTSADLEALGLSFEMPNAGK